MLQKLLKPLKTKITNDNKKVTQQIIFAKLKTAIYQLDNGKSTGIDGIPIEYFKFYYEYLKYDLLQLYNLILFENNNLTTSLNQAIITFSFKNDKKENLKNWRPISLLCSDYKILTKILSNRLKPTLEHTILIEQTCRISKRSIFLNLFITKNTHSFIVSID